MLVLPLFKKLWRNKWPGVIQSRSTSGATLRRATMAINPRTPRQVLWRQLFGQSRKNWLAIGPGGADYILTGGLEPQAAWALELAATYNVLQPAYLERDIQLPSQLANISTPLAYFTAIQTALAAMNLPPRPTPTFTIVGGVATPTLYTPSFAFPTSLACITVLDTTFIVTGFYLTYVAIPLPGAPSPGLILRNGAAMNCYWKLSASPVYTSIYNPPPASAIAPISYNAEVFPPVYAQVMPNLAPPTGILAAWEAAYGPLPASGYIKFSAQLIDPLTGVAGPALSCTASFANGSFRGNAQSAWQGNFWGLSGATLGTPIDAPTSVTLTLTLGPAVNTADPTTGDAWTTPVNQWPPAYTFPRTFAITAKASALLTQTTTGYSQSPVPGVTVALSASSLTFANESAAAQTVSATITFSSDAPSTDFTLTFEATDTLYLLSDSASSTISNSALPPGFDGGFEMDAFTYSPGLTAGTSTTFAIVLSNNTPQPITISMLGYNQSIDAQQVPAIIASLYGISFDIQQPTIPPGTYSSPGTITVNCTIAVPAGIDTLTIQTQIEATTGTQSTFATVT